MRKVLLMLFLFSSFVEISVYAGSKPKNEKPASKNSQKKPQTPAPAPKKALTPAEEPDPLYRYFYNDVWKLNEKPVNNSKKV